MVTPTASGTATFKGAGFAVQVNSSVWYNCQPQASGGGPAATLVVGTGTPSSTATSTSTGTPTTTTSNTPTSTTTSSTPRPTRTHTEVVTVTPSDSPTKRSSRTPKAGADTGGGGLAGPDGRTFILTGTALVAAAAIGGLFLRRRNAARS
ncbi:hypothetical protein [Nonomuraea sp. NPDC050783]|uniref:hypothetical protein n=1 Tax=Nonomuraea sp. NPDC050783 TaxID=3154634 RepID=UPI0034654809